MLHPILSFSVLDLAPTLLILPPVQGIERFKKVASAAQGGILNGEDVFLLWDTFGFPVDLTELMAQEQGLKVDKQGGWVKAWVKGADMGRAGARKLGRLSTPVVVARQALRSALRRPARNPRQPARRRLRAPSSLRRKPPAGCR